VSQQNHETPAEAEFWCVWGGVRDRPPTVPHGTLAAAQAEAMRLAQLHPGVKFYALKAVSGYVAEIEIKGIFLDSAAGPQS
jgi:hypothetical protein